MELYYRDLFVWLFKLFGVKFFGWVFRDVFKGNWFVCSDFLRVWVCVIEVFLDLGELWLFLINFCVKILEEEVFFILLLIFMKDYVI